MVRACNEYDTKPHYLVMYLWPGEDQRPDNFVLPRHGNVTRSTINAYYRKDPKLLTEIDGMLQKGMSKVPLQRRKKKPLVEGSLAQK